MRALGKDLSIETESLSKALEPGYKQLAVKSYACMAACFRKPQSSDDCTSCAEECSSTLTQYNSDMDEVFQSIHVGFQTCLQQCDIRDETASKGCVVQCATETKTLIFSMKAQAQDLVNKYLN